jgi:fucose 4-O-acetylase-like acetyltransferase
VLSAIAIVYNITPDIDYCRYGILPIFLVGAIAGTLFCLLISNFISKSRPLEYLGRNSLIIMGFSEPVKRLILGVFSMATHKSMDDVRYSLPISLLCATVTILVLIPIIYIFTKYLPFTIGLSNKKKTGTIN